MKNYISKWIPFWRPRLSHPGIDKKIDVLEYEPVKLYNKNFILLWQGQFVSQIGNQVFLIALMFWLKHATGSASLMSTLMMLSVLPAVILGPFGGTVADRYSRRKIIIISDAINGFAVLSLAIVLFLLPKEITLIIVCLFICSVIGGISAAFFRPAASAIIPDIVPRKKISTANSLKQSAMQLSMFIGQGIGGVLYRLLGAPVLFLIDALTFLFSSISELFIRLPKKVIPLGNDNGDFWQDFLSDTKIGFNYIWNLKGLRNLIIVAAMMNFFMAPFIIVLSFYVEDYLHTKPDWFGYLIAADAIGMFIGSLLAGILKISSKSKVALMIFVLIGSSITIGSLALIKTPHLALIMLFIDGVLIGLFQVHLITILQITTPEDIRGRVFGLMGTLSGIMYPIGLGLTGFVLDAINHDVRIIYGVSGSVTLILSMLLGLSRSFRNFIEFSSAESKSV